MAGQRTGREAAVTVFVVIVVGVASFGLAVFASNPGNTANSVSSKRTQLPRQPNSYSVTTPSGLKLDVNLNATTIGVGSALGARVTFYNPFDRNLSVLTTSPPNPTIAAWTADDFVCSSNSLNLLAAYALFQGHYSPENISSAGDPLVLAPPVYLPCMGAFGTGSAVFLPDSSNASLGWPEGTYGVLSTNATTEYCQDVPNLAGTYSIECPVGSSLFGYWDNVTCCLGAATTSSSHFHYLPPGEYTLAVVDEWNQTICAPFEVSTASKNHVGDASAQITGYNGGHEVSVSLENIGESPIASLNASLAGFALPTTTYSFSFNDTSSTNPAVPGKTITSATTVVGSAIDPTKQYALTIAGYLANGTRFSYSGRVWIVPLGRN